MLRDLGADLAAALRALRRQPGFSALTILTLALGVGSTAAVFGMANQLLFRPLPGTEDPEGAAYLQFRSVSEPESTQGRGLALPDFRTLREEATLVEEMASYGHAGWRVSRGNERPISVRGSTVYGDFFEVLGVRAAEGRLLRAEETELGGDPRLAVISEELRATLFGSEAAVGRTVQVNEEPVTIIGVAGGGFRGPERGAEMQMWAPHPALVPLNGFPLERLESRNSVMHSNIVARTREGVGAEAVEAQIADILSRLAEANPESREWLADLTPMLFPGLHVRPLMRERTYGSLRILAGIVGLVLLIACANVANLLLFRNVSRRGALATRRALGASSGRIARQHLAESLVLGTLGTLAGLGVAWLVALPFQGESLVRMPAFDGFTVDGRVLAFAGIVSVVTAVLFGAVPAALAGRFDLGAALKEAGGRETRGHARIRRIMSAGQVALSLTLLVGGLLLVRTVRNLYSVDTGFSIGGVVALPLNPGGGPEGSAAEALRRDLLTAVTVLPAVEGAALDLYGPHGSRMMGRVALRDAPDDEAGRAMVWPVTPGWFDLLDVETVDGRPLRREDEGSGPETGVVITSSLARRLFGATDVAGRTLRAGMWELEEVRVVGVTEDLRAAHSLDEPQDAVFVPFGSNPLPSMTLLVGTREFNPQVARQIRSAVERVLPDQPVPDPTLLADRLTRIHSERRIFSQLLGLLSILAVVLAAVGLYGVIAFAVAGRVREFGIRLALGADGSRIARLVLRDATTIVVSGTVLGLAGAYLLSSVLESRLFGVERIDPVSYASAVLLLAAVATLACWKPARSAARVDPVETLKVE